MEKKNNPVGAQEGGNINEESLVKKTYYIPKELDKKVKLTAIDKGYNASFLVRKALEEYLKD